MEDYRRYLKVFKAFSDENRIMILQMLQNGEKCACHILNDLAISQSTLSHHMKILCDSGVVLCHKQGKWSHYALNPQGCEQAEALLRELTHQTAQRNALQ